MKIKEIYQWMDHFAPFHTQETFDNSGLIIGDPEEEITGLGFALDITSEVIQKAEQHQINLIITHHPVIFDPMKQILANTTAYQLIRRGISVISAHTNLDKAEGGINTVLAKYYMLENIASPLCLSDLGRIGNLKQPMSVEEYAKQIKENLHSDGIRYYDAGKPVCKVAYSSGRGTGLFQNVLECDIDTFVTGDVKHEFFVEAQTLGLNLIDAGHFDTENVVFDSLSQRIEQECGIKGILLSDQNRVKTI
jgi:dinuclear metal center YbgI/SA1388 family protein